MLHENSSATTWQTDNRDDKRKTDTYLLNISNARRHGKWGAWNGTDTSEVSFYGISHSLYPDLYLVAHQCLWPKVDDLQAHYISQSVAMWAWRSAIFGARNEQLKYKYGISRSSTRQVWKKKKQDCWGLWGDKARTDIVIVWLKVIKYKNKSFGYMAHCGPPRFIIHVSTVPLSSRCFKGPERVFRGATCQIYIRHPVKANKRPSQEGSFGNQKEALYRLTSSYVFECSGISPPHIQFSLAQSLICCSTPPSCQNYTAYSPVFLKQWARDPKGGRWDVPTGAMKHRTALIEDYCVANNVGFLSSKTKQKTSPVCWAAESPMGLYTVVSPWLPLLNRL